MEKMYGNYRGVVKAHGENGLCKVYIPAVYPLEYSDTPTELPWTEPAQPLTMGGRDGVGIFSYPKIDTTIWVFFEGGDINYPVMFSGTLGGSENFNPDKYVIKTDALTIEVDEKGVITLNITTTGKTRLTTPLLEIKGNVIITGTLLVKGLVTSLTDFVVGVITLVTHIHKAGSPPGNTGPPTAT